MSRTINYSWSRHSGGARASLDLARVDGTGEADAYPFGDRLSGSGGPRVVVGEFYIALVPAFQGLWKHVMGSDATPAVHQVNDDLPVENVSWDSLHSPEGFLNVLNASPVPGQLMAQAPELNGRARFRLPTETEWEYAARGGCHWPDGYSFSGSNDIDAVAWYNRKQGDCTKPVGLKAPNQLGLFDLSGNVWEWCEDVFTPDTTHIPADGSPYSAPGPDRVLRGGCFHNWAVHCTVSKRYAIASDAYDGCIGFRLVLA